MSADRSCGLSGPLAHAPLQYFPLLHLATVAQRVLSLTFVGPNPNLNRKGGVGCGLKNICYFVWALKFVIFIVF